SHKADEKIARLDAEITRLSHDIANITETTEKWYRHLKEKYGDQFPRLTTIRNFDSIEATKVAEANRRLMYDAEGQFIGTGLKEGEFLFTCSDLDDILVIYRDGSYKIVRVSDKLYVGKSKSNKIMHIGLFKKNDRRTIYNVIYRNGKGGNYYMKRCFITGLTREKDYDITKGLPGSRIEWLSCNPNGEAETVKVSLIDEPNGTGRRPRNTELTINFADQLIKGKDSLGNLVTKFKVKNITLEKKGSSTLGGREVWFDRDVLRLNYDRRGESLGVFQGDDKVLVITRNGEYFTSSYADTNHYEDNIRLIEKFDPEKIWTLALHDNALGYPYLKRFKFEATVKPQRFLGGDEGGELLLLTDKPGARLLVTFAGADEARPALEVDAEEFIALKSFKAKGKRLTTFTIGKIEDITPDPDPEEETAPDSMEQETELDPEEGVIDVEAEDVTEEPDAEPSLFADLD
ncbi:MAG: DNA gyrase/topoisomerase IV subunit A, partial [Muribaculaceae bacterium]|nr:DNA gyrase/topoisomerase IV subunit A [Muribaculaceae bacterium]